MRLSGSLIRPFEVRTIEASRAAGNDWPVVVIRPLRCGTAHAWTGAGQTRKPGLAATLLRLLRWLPFLDTYQTLCMVPPPDFQRLLENIRQLWFAA
jgi:hypothetical protein